MEVLFVDVMYQTAYLTQTSTEDAATRAVTALIKVFHVNSCYATPFATKKGIPVV